MNYNNQVTNIVSFFTLNIELLCKILITFIIEMKTRNWVTGRMSFMLVLGLIFSLLDCSLTSITR
jgi:hypothetical protein